MINEQARCPICYEQVTEHSDENEKWHLNCPHCGYNSDADQTPRAFDDFETQVQCEEVYHTDEQYFEPSKDIA